MEWPIFAGNGSSDWSPPRAATALANSATPKNHGYSNIIDMHDVVR